MDLNKLDPVAQRRTRERNDEKVLEKNMSGKYFNKQV